MTSELQAAVVPTSSRTSQKLQRLQAAVAIRRVKRSESLKVVMGYANDADVEVRRAAVEGLLTIGGDDAASIILLRLNDANAEIRELAASSLGMMRDRSCTSYLCDVMYKDPEPRVALAAAGALARIGNTEEAVPYLVTMLCKRGPLQGMAARLFGQAVGQKFRANSEGIKAAQRYAKAYKIVK